MECNYKFDDLDLIKNINIDLNVAKDNNIVE